MIEMNSSKHLAKELQDGLTRLYGPLLAAKDLWKILGYGSPAAYRQARARKSLPVAEFEIEGRRGHFALTKDVALWLAGQKFSNSPDKNELVMIESEKNEEANM